MENQSVKACPFCGEMVLAVAIKCKHCQSMIASLPRAEQPADAEEPAPLSPVLMSSAPAAPAPAGPAGAMGAGMSRSPGSDTPSADPPSAVAVGEASELHWPPIPGQRKSASNGSGALIATVIGAVLAVGLFVTNPTQEDFKKFIVKRIDGALTKEEWTNPVKTSDPFQKLGREFGKQIVSGIASFAIDKMTTRTNFGLFSIYEIDFSTLRSLGLTNQSNGYVVGIAGQFIGSQQDAAAAVASAATNKPGSANKGTAENGAAVGSPGTTKTRPANESEAAATINRFLDKGKQAIGQTNVLESLMLAAAIPSNESYTFKDWESIQKISGVNWAWPFYETGAHNSTMKGTARWGSNANPNIGAVEINVTGARTGPMLFTVLIKNDPEVDESALSSWRFQRIKTTCDSDLASSRFNYFRIERDGYKPIYMWLEKSFGASGDAGGVSFTFGGSHDDVILQGPTEKCKVLKAIR